MLEPEPDENPVKTLAIVLTAAMLTTTGCTSDVWRGEDIESFEDVKAAADARLLAEEFVDLANARAETLCDCATEYGFTSQDECLRYFDYVNPQQLSCLRDVVSVDPDAARTYLECAVEQADDLAICLDPMVCLDGERVDVCHANFREDLDGCPELPLDMLVEMASCLE